MATSPQLRESLKRIENTTVAVFGDFCLDAYWVIDDGEQELSIETGLPMKRVRTQAYSLGGAANVVANLVDLGVHSVKAVGLVGTDVFGPKLTRLLSDRGVQIESLAAVETWETMVYAKPFLTGNEESRFDFGTFNAMTVDLEDCLIASLAATAATSDVVVLNQQIPNGITGRALVERINGVIAAYPEVPFVVDARHIADAYRAAVLKLNIAEACRYLGVPFHHAIGRSEALDYAGEIHLRTGKPAFITRGAGGIVVAADGDVVSVPGLRIHGPVDTVGAGDTVAAALAAALGSGQSARQAAELANVAAMITVQKLGTTGTASPQEIADAAENLEYVAEV